MARSRRKNSYRHPWDAAFRHSRIITLARRLLIQKICVSAEFFIQLNAARIGSAMAFSYEMSAAIVSNYFRLPSPIARQSCCTYGKADREIRIKNSDLPLI